MKRKRRKFFSKFKAKVVLEAIKERQTLSELAEKYELHPNQITAWKKEFLSNDEEVFTKKSSKKNNTDKELAKLYRKIGQLEIEKDFLKKLRRNLSFKKRKEMINAENKMLSQRKQCKLLSISRGSLYYKPLGESKFNLKLMRLIDEIHLEEPAFGVLRLQDELEERGYKVNVKRIHRLRNKMRIKTIYAKRNLSKPGRAKYIHPYLLRNLKIERANQVWAIDITYIPMRRGFVYLTAVIDVHSRYILGWQLSNSLDKQTQTDLAKELFEEYGTPEIINSDQGSHYTFDNWMEYLKSSTIKISIDGKGRAKDNIYIERFWRSIIYDYIYLNPTQNGPELYHGTDNFIKKYNRRKHQGIGRVKPIKLYATERKNKLKSA